MNFTIISFYVGRIVQVEAVFLLPGLVLSMLYGEVGATRGFLVAIVAAFILSALFRANKPSRRSVYTREGLAIVAMSWIMISLIGALPFIIDGAIPSFLDAFFETVSGFTTTGASILKDVEIVPKSLLYWRSFTHWLGGMGVLVFFLAIAPRGENKDEGSLHILQAESPGPVVGKLVPKMRRTAAILYQIYFVMTVIQIGLLLIGKMPLFDAVCIAFGSAGTGGFAVLNSSLASYSPYLQTITAVFMMLFGINFNIFYLILIKEYSKALFNEELRAYLAIMFTSTLLIAINIMPLFKNFFEALHHSYFQVSSVMTTTGYATQNFAVWPSFSKYILLILMVLGASAGSTGGGIKTARFVIMIKSFYMGLQKQFYPRSVKTMHMDGKVIDEDVQKNVNSYFVAYFIIAVLSLIIVSLDNFSVETTLSAVLACLNNIGPGLDVVGPAANYSMMSALSKVVLTLDMLLGRLEIFPILILFSPNVWRRGSKNAVLK